MPEFELNFPTVLFWLEYLGFDKPFERRDEVVQVLLEEGRQEVRPERAAHTRRRLHYATASRPTIEALRQHFGQNKGKIGRPPRPGNLLRPLIDQGKDQLLHKQGNAVRRLDRALHDALRQIARPRNGVRQRQAVLRAQLLEANRLVRGRQRRSFWKETGRRHEHERDIFQRLSDLDKQFGRRWVQPVHVLHTKDRRPGAHDLFEGRDDEVELLPFVEVGRRRYGFDGLRGARTNEAGDDPRVLRARHPKLREKLVELASASGEVVSER